MEKDIHKEKEDQLKWDTQWVLSTEQGRRFLWDFLSFCGIYHDIQGNSQDMLKQIGRRQAGLHLLGLISNASEESLLKMMHEAHTRSIEEKIKYERTNKSATSESNTSINDTGGYSASGSDVDTSDYLADLVGELPTIDDCTFGSGPNF